MCVGVRPEIRLAREAGLETGRGIRVNEKMKTSDDSVYAVGDAVETKSPVTGEYALVPLAWPAARQALVAANDICGVEDSYAGPLGTSIVKVFSLAAAMTGATEKMLKKAGKRYSKVYTHPGSHAGYYPGASQLAVKLLFDPGDGKVLGAQVIGHEGADKRTDILSVAVRHGLSVRDLANLDLCYAPPYGSAKDAVNLAGMAACNHLTGLSRLVHWEDLTGAEHLLDVRTDDEFRQGSVAGACNIPLDVIRERMKDIPRNKKIAVFCQVGIRGHIAVRILAQNGFDAANVSGGYRTYLNYRDSFAAGSGAPACETGLRETFCTSPTGEPASGPEGKTETLDLRGLQCPGPIMRIREASGRMDADGRLKVLSNDPGFSLDLPRWCRSTGHSLLSMQQTDEGTVAVITKEQEAPGPSSPSGGASGNGTTIVVFSGDLDKAMAAFIIARAAAAAGRKVTMFFTFWGLNMLKKLPAPKIKKDILSRMFAWMMPSSAEKLALSKMNMMGLGTAMMKHVMKRRNVDSLAALLTGAVQDGIEFVACSMSMDVMGIRKEELIDGVRVGGAAYYVGGAAESSHNLFI
jgi:peroxiredoxin family protein/TusA-related sulfurtransferase/rhodanese-related sulfurtransferase